MPGMRNHSRKGTILPVKRRLFNLLAGLSLLLCVAAGTMYWRTDRGDFFQLRVNNGKYYRVLFVPRGIALSWSEENPKNGRAGVFAISHGTVLG